MDLNVIVDERNLTVHVPDHLLSEAEEFFTKMDSDMNDGWQMSREWVSDPNTVQRCQIAADQLLAAVENGNEAMQVMMAAYILSRAPGVSAVRVNTAGEMQETELLKN